MTTTTRRTHCPTTWIGSGVYSTTATTHVTCELPLTNTDGDELPDTTCGYQGDTDVTYSDLGLVGTWTCPSCQRTNNTTEEDDADGEPDTDTGWDFD